MIISSTMIWGGIPLFAGLLLWLLSTWRNAVFIITLNLCLLLATLAWLLTFNQIHSLGYFSLTIVENFALFDQSFLLISTWRPILGGIFLLMALFTIGAYYLDLPASFSIYVTTFPGSLIATLAIRPYHYAAIPILIALFILAFALFDSKAPQSTFRMLIILLAGAALLLTSGPLLAGVEVNPGSLDIIQRGSIILGISLWLLLSIFPFHHWIPMIMQSGNLYLRSFLVLMIQSFISLYALTLLDRFAWLREANYLYSLLLGIAAISILYNGITSIFESNPGRLLGHAILLDTGFLIAAIGLGTNTGYILYFALMLPRFISVLFWAGGVQWALNKNPEIKSSEEIWTIIGTKHPAAMALLITAFFSLIGVPGLANFPLKLSLWQSLIKSNLAIVGITLIGNFAMLFGFMQVIYQMIVPISNVNPAEKTQNPVTLLPELASRRLFYGIGTVVAIGMAMLFSIYPQWFLPIFEHMPDILKFTLPTN